MKYLKYTFIACLLLFSFLGYPQSGEVKFGINVGYANHQGNICKLGIGTKKQESNFAIPFSKALSKNGTQFNIIILNQFMCSQSTISTTVKLASNSTIYGVIIYF